MTMILMGTGPAHRHLAPHQEDPSQEREEEREREQEQEPVADLEVEVDLEAEADRKVEAEADQPAEVEEQLQLFNSGRRPVVTRSGYREESQTGTGSRRSHYPQVRTIPIGCERCA
jgi:hypothetical protein